MLLSGKCGVVLGVANKRSIATACARAASAQGARLVLTYQGDRVKETVEALAASLPNEAVTLPCDVTSDESLDDAFAAIGDHMGQVDFAIHSVAFAERSDLEGRFVDTSRSGFGRALDVSTYSMIAVARRLEPLMAAGGSLVTMSYLGGLLVMPRYNVMGPAKAALESCVRYLASDMGPKGIRVNTISAGPIRTLAASGVTGFNSILEVAEQKNPLRRNTTAEEVGDAAVFLASEMSRGITGSILWVDCGFHVMAV